MFIFLFQSFPLGDKSSVNLRGEYHVENVTTFDELRRSADGVDQEMDVDAADKAFMESAGNQGAAASGLEISPSAEADQVAKVAKSVTFDADRDSGKVIDMDTFYSIFWTLQQDFSNPTRLFESARFEAFRKGLEATITKFKDVQSEDDVRNVSKLAEEQTGTKRKRGERADDLASNFNPKYLTSRDLFELEVCDVRPSQISRVLLTEYHRSAI